MRNIITLIGIIISIVVFGCQPKKTRNNNFYNYSKDWDLDRIPLIQPYELISADKGYLWVLRNKELDYKKKKYYDAGVEKVGVYFNYIILYTSSTYFDYKMTELWIVINTHNDTTVYYTEEDKYITGIRKMEIKIPLTLYTTSEIFNKFKDSFILPEEWNNKEK